MLLTASFDGTAKIWQWNSSSPTMNKGNKSLVTLSIEPGGFIKKQQEQ